jgi:hypothetical protein
LWAGASRPGANWTGVGGGWWMPPAGYKPPAPPAPKPAPAPAGAQPQNPSYSGTTVTAPTSPLDSTYQASVDTNAAQTANKIAQLNLQQSQGGVNLQQQLAGYAHQQPLDELAARVAANRRGALYSTGLGQQIGNIGYGYTAKRTAAQDAYQQLADSIAQQIAGAQSGQQAYQAAQYADAVQRASQAAQANPALGESMVPPINDTAVAPGTRAPARVLIRPKGAPANAKWAGPRRLGANWRGIGGGWWVPTR